MTETAPLLTVPEVLERRAADDGDGIAFIVDGGPQLTYREWEARSRSVAHGLIDAGIGKGDRVALMFGGLDWIDYAVAYQAVLRAGATAIHFNNELPDDEIEARLAECRVVRVIRSPQQIVPASFAGPVSTVSTLETGSTAPLDVAIDPADITDILYTSGTTGRGKPYTVPHGNLTFGRSLDAFAALAGQPRSIMLVPMLLGNSTSATCVNAAVSAPAVSVVCDPADVVRMGQLIEQFKVDTMAISPWTVKLMLDAKVHELSDLSSLTRLMCAGAALAPAMSLRILKAVPSAKLIFAGAQSEAGPALIMGKFDPTMAMCLGMPLPGTEVSIRSLRDETPVPAGTLGQIWLRHQAPKKLYLDRSRSAQLEIDGWHRTGDWGWVAEDGHVFLFDRSEDVIHTAEGPVSSLRVESIAYEHDSVTEAAAFAVPDGDGHSRVALAVALSDDADFDDVETWANARFSGKERPVAVVLVDTLPRNSRDKVLKRELRAQFADLATAPV